MRSIGGEVDGIPLQGEGDDEVRGLANPLSKNELNELKGCTYGHLKR